MMRAVTNTDYVGACRYTGYIDKTARLTLDCGHQKYQKASQRVPQRTNCVECDREQEAAASGKSYRCVRV